MLINICMICTFSLLLLCRNTACLSGALTVCVLFRLSIVLLSVEYLHNMSCKHLLPLYVVSSTSCPCDFFPMALIMVGLWCLGLLIFGSRVLGIDVGSCVVDVSSCNPSWLVYRACR